jgi:hypothetical protein
MYPESTGKHEYGSVVIAVAMHFGGAT